MCYHLQMSNSGNWKETQDIYFKKLLIKKVLIKLRVLSDDSVLIKCRFNKQAPQKVLIELNRLHGKLLFYKSRLTLHGAAGRFNDFTVILINTSTFHKSRIVEFNTKSEIICMYIIKGETKYKYLLEKAE